MAGNPIKDHIEIIKDSSIYNELDGDKFNGF